VDLLTGEIFGDVLHRGLADLIACCAATALAGDFGSAATATKSGLPSTP